MTNRSLDERLVQYRDFLEERIKKYQGDIDRHKEGESTIHSRIAIDYYGGIQETYISSRDKLYELFPELKPKE